MELVRRVLALAGVLLHEKGNFLCKVFQGEDFPAFFGEVRECFHMAKTVKPQSSRSESREAFVVGAGYIKGAVKN